MAFSVEDALIKVLDMSPAMKESAIETIVEVLNSETKESKMSEQIKQKFDELYGSAWHCVVGKSFGLNVTHETSSFLFLQIKEYNVVLWKNGTSSD
eukprot:TRINITY_DN85409_c0_g1_i1.p1 TRINITY_DN85409_c0_g1~~TRINITY_DN85409_c0_g1_i1.p1  ORF type:complete len:96 (-),score=18.00 TRINITY_DN85409_c0_g1_i1:50-337(-)